MFFKCYFKQNFFSQDLNPSLRASFFFSLDQTTAPGWQEPHLHNVVIVITIDNTAEHVPVIELLKGQFFLLSRQDDGSRADRKLFG